MDRTPPETTPTQHGTTALVGGPSDLVALSPDDLTSGRAAGAEGRTVPPATVVDAAPDGRHHRRPATPLAVTSVVLGALATAMALGVVWFFLALPFGIAAATCALVDRRRTRRATGTPAGGVTTIGLVLGLSSIPLALGALLIIPQVETLTRDSAAALQSDVQVDLDGVERTATDNVDRLDRTLRDLVRSDNEGWSKEFAALGEETGVELKRTEDELRALLEEFERTIRDDMDRLERSVRSDVQSADGRAAAVEADLRAEIVRINEDVAQLRAFVDSIR